MSVKDLFDVAGRTTRAGSAVLDGAAPATADAAIVTRLRRAGAVIVGKTNMTEFAYSGLGINPHYGTPRSRRTIARPGASRAAPPPAPRYRSPTAWSSRASAPTPAVRCASRPRSAASSASSRPRRRVPLTGAYPLSFTLDSIGPLARSVACCATLDAILAGEEPAPLDVPPVRRWRFLAPVNYVRNGLDAIVAAAFAAALATVRAAGAQVDEAPLPALERLPALQSGATITGAEAYWWHREILAAGEARYDPQIARRILRGATISAAEYIDLLRGRRAYIDAFHAESEGYDALLWPTVAIVPPAVRSLEGDDEAYAAANALILRNTSAVNALDGCALSLPLTGAGGAPAGLMLVGRRGEDARLLRIGAAVEASLG